MMNFDSAEALLRQFTYKPGSRFCLWRRAQTDETVLSILMYVPNVMSDQREPIQLTMSTRFTALALHTREEFIAAVADLVERFEKHESSEWLKLKGRTLVDPHPELALAFEIKSRIEP